MDMEYKKDWKVNLKKIPKTISYDNEVHLIYKVQETTGSFVLQKVQQTGEKNLQSMVASGKICDS